MAASGPHSGATAGAGYPEGGPCRSGIGLGGLTARGPSFIPKVRPKSPPEPSWIFARFLDIVSGTELAREVAKRGIRTHRGNPIDRKFLYRMLNHRAYIGEAVHKGESYPGKHDAIIDRETWDRVHGILQESPRKRAARTRAETPALLKGLLFGPMTRRSRRRTPARATGSSATMSARPC